MTQPLLLCDLAELLDTDVITLMQIYRIALGKYISTNMAVDPDDALRVAKIYKEEHLEHVEVVVEPDYWSRGHFYPGNKAYIDLAKLYDLPIGTKLVIKKPK